MGGTTPLPSGMPRPFRPNAMSLTRSLNKTGLSPVDGCLGALSRLLTGGGTDEGHATGEESPVGFCQALFALMGPEARLWRRSWRRSWEDQHVGVAAQPVSPVMKPRLGELPEPKWDRAPVRGRFLGTLRPVDAATCAGRQSPTASAQIFFAVPASPLRPRRWMASEADPPASEPAGGLPSMLRLLPLRLGDPAPPPVPWEEPQAGYGRQPAAPSVGFARWLPVTAYLARATAAAQPAQFSAPRLWLQPGPLPLDANALQREWQRYAQRMEWKILLLAEQTRRGGIAPALAAEGEFFEPPEMPAVAEILSGIPSVREGKPASNPRPFSVSAPPGVASRDETRAGGFGVALAGLAGRIGGDEVDRDGWRWPAPVCPAGSPPAAPPAGRAIAVEAVSAPAPPRISISALAVAVAGAAPSRAVPGEVPEVEPSLERAVLLPLAEPAPHPGAAPIMAEYRGDPARRRILALPVTQAVLDSVFDGEQPLLPITDLCGSWIDKMTQPPRIDPCPWPITPALPAVPLRRLSFEHPVAPPTLAPHSTGQALQKHRTSWARQFGPLGPSELIWFTLALALLATVWLWSPRSGPPSPADAVETAAEPFAGQAGLPVAFNANGGLTSLRQRVANRSSIALREDFSAGFGFWEGGRAWSRSWRHGQDRVARPGQLAIYQPSVPMRDYELTLLAAVEHRSISWVVRARNLRNYVAVRINLASPGASQPSSLERWTVKDGRVTQRRSIGIETPHSAAKAMRVRMEVQGTVFKTLLEDRVVDVFMDTTHASGGVGLFASPEDQPRIYRLEVTHQQDFLGKLCSFFATHPITTAGTPGS